MTALLLLLQAGLSTASRSDGVRRVSRSQQSNRQCNDQVGEPRANRVPFFADRPGASSSKTLANTHISYRRDKSKAECLGGEGSANGRGLPRRPLGKQDRARADRRIDAVVVRGAAVVGHVSPSGPPSLLMRRRRRRRRNCLRFVCTGASTAFVRAPPRCTIDLHRETSFGGPGYLLACW